MYDSLMSIGEPKSHKILILICLQKDDKQSCDATEYSLCWEEEVGEEEKKEKKK